MGFFNRLFGKDDKAPQPQQAKTQQHLAPCKSKQELIEHYGGIAMEKQLRLVEIIGSNNWNVDMPKGEISFGANLNFPIQVLGTFSHSSQTWLWAWANSQSGLPENILQHALKLKQYGEENEIDLLRNSQFEADNPDLHMIGLIASGMFGAGGYYIADYGQGAMVVTIKTDKTNDEPAEYHYRILTAFPQLISQFDMNHKRALTNYLAAKDYKVNDNGANLSATKNGNTISAEFDAGGRLTKLNG